MTDIQEISEFKHLCSLVTYDGGYGVMSEQE